MEQCAQLLVVMYHYIRKDLGVGGERAAAKEGTGRTPEGGQGRAGTSGVRGLSLDEFAAQIDFLCRMLEPIDWPRLCSWLERHPRNPHPALRAPALVALSLGKREGAFRSAATQMREPSRRFFLLTFDDGLKDHVETVAPILKHRGLSGVFFVPGAVLAERRMLDAHAVHRLLVTLGEESFERELFAALQDEGFSSSAAKSKPDPPHPALSPRGGEGYWNNILGPDQAARAAAMYHYETPRLAQIKYLLNVALPTELRHRIVSVLFERHVGSQAEWAERWYLNGRDIRELQAAGHTIGAHGFSHEILTRLSPERQREDFRKATDILNAQFGPASRPFSYPFGAFDDGVARRCAEAGFAHAFTTKHDWLTPSIDPFRLPRVDTIHVDEFLTIERSGSEFDPSPFTKERIG